MKEFIKFVRSVLSESDGTGSWSRCGSLLLALATITWVSYVVCRTHAIPDLQGPAWFLTTGTGSLYGTNQLKSIVSAFTGKGKDGVPAGAPGEARGQE